ncbi:hypothetical protein WR25_26607 [Diploscapter pachys]|uniref:Uncharacterized protein n=1 Tax=Diploscapter pachys TaxID=2018661 RepID=A0A2A2JXM3_9BILA|nr:hypothetical protein WR25_26607 [Diploscapter pachys]
MVEAGEPLLLEALEALRTYHNAQAAGVPAEEVERLRVIAESAYQAVQHQLFRVFAGHACCDPFNRQIRRQHDRPAVVHIDQAALGVGSDDHEPVVLIAGELTY